MAMRNYRQAKRSREDARKKRQQEKLERKMNKPAPVPGAADPAAPLADGEPKEST